VLCFCFIILRIVYPIVANFSGLSISDCLFGIILRLFRNRWKSEHIESFSHLFRRECKWIWYFPTMYVYCVYHTMSKSTKQPSNCLERTETNVVLIICNGVLCPRLCWYLSLGSLNMNKVPEKPYGCQFILWKRYYALWAE
jgi:hypothetical protein